MVLTQVEVVVHLDFQAFSDLLFSHARPLFDHVIQVDVVVDCIVVELFLLDSVSALSKLLVHPEENVEQFHAGNQQFHINVSSSYDV